VLKSFLSSLHEMSAWQIEFLVGSNFNVLQSRSTNEKNKIVDAFRKGEVANAFFCVNGYIIFGFLLFCKYTCVFTNSPSFSHASFEITVAPFRFPYILENAYSN
jgi:hypothetical protein